MEGVLSPLIPQTFWNILPIIMDLFIINMLLISKPASLAHICILGFGHMRLANDTAPFRCPKGSQTQHFQINSPSPSPKASPLACIPISGNYIIIY